ncbi:MAG: hypothetical protein L0211_01620 [Planctomycetaceae bacterium]|nr:hypothetical protein [Planctomycetaceae bacterium]
MARRADLRKPSAAAPGGRSIVKTRPSATAMPEKPGPIGACQTTGGPPSGNFGAIAGACQVPSPRGPRQRGQSSARMPAANDKTAAIARADLMLVTIRLK